MTRAFFVGQMRRLAGLRFVPADFASHWEAIQRVPALVLEAAVGRALTAQSDFPTPHELLAYADLVRPQSPSPVDDESRRTPLAEPIAVDVLGVATVNVREVWRYDHEDCSDTGMVSYWCGDSDMPKPWYRRRTCERRGPHYAHEWVGPCPCAESNPTIQRRKAARVKYAAEPATSRRGA